MNIKIEEVVNEYSNMVLQIAYQRAFNMSDAEDIAQEVFIKLIDNQEKIQNEKHLKAWLIRVTSNLSNDYNKLFWNKNVSELDETQSFVQDEELGVFDEVKKLTPPIYRDIIYLYFYQGYKIKEIAEILNMSMNTVSSALTRSKEKLKGILKEVEIYG
jgi:RNA polymerase sigma-70 factor (ECF subfamily)